MASIGFRSSNVRMKSPFFTSAYRMKPGFNDISGMATATSPFTALKIASKSSGIIELSSS